MPVNTTVLLDFEGATVVDRSANAIPVTNGGMVLSTAQAKFGTQSAQGGGHLSMSNAALLVGTQAFTISFWIYQTASSGERFYMDTRDGPGGTRGFCVICRSGCVGFSDGVTLIGTDAPAQMAANTWQHVEACRTVDGNAYVFLNGVLVASSTTHTFTNSFQSISHVVGSAQYFPLGVEPFAGYMDEYQFIIGTALHTANFTPPAGPYGINGDDGTEQTVATSAGTSVTAMTARGAIVVAGDSAYVVRLLHEMRLVLVPADCDAMRMPVEACAVVIVPIEYSVMTLSCEPAGVSFASGILALDARAMPWDTSINPTYTYVSGGGNPPAKLPVAPGQLISITCSGQVSYFNGSDGNGPEGRVREANGFTLPSDYAPGHNSTTHDFVGIVGAWCDDSGHVLQPVWIGLGGNFLAPAGAHVLQIGINDWRLTDNSGTFTVAWHT